MIVAYDSTSTGQSTHISGGPFTKVAIEVTNGPGTVAVEGRVGSVWTTLIAASTFNTAGLIATSTGDFLVSSVRANFSAWGSTAVTPGLHLLGA